MKAFQMSVAVFLTAAVTAAAATVKTETVQYTAGETALQGYLAYPAEGKEKSPAVLVFSDWRGLGDHSRRRADELAGLGYVALVADMYGGGKMAGDDAEASTLAGALKKGDRAEMRKRAGAALAALKANPRVDPNRIAAIGYCFGGTVALELARSGAELQAVVGFHAGLDTPQPAHPGGNPGTIKAAILVCHGANDPHVPKAEVDAFLAEMTKSGTDWQMVFYGGAVHSFSNPAAGDNPSKGSAYQAAADRRSWELMQSFFRERLAGGGGVLAAP